MRSERGRRSAVARAPAKAMALKKAMADKGYSVTEGLRDEERVIDLVHSQQCELRLTTK